MGSIKEINLMKPIKVKNIYLEGDKFSISTWFRKYSFQKDEIRSFKIEKISSLYDEIGIELQCDRTFLITERVAGFFDLAKFLSVEEIFGPLWYKDSEDGQQLEHTYRVSKSL
jgi:hypothetical protein